MPLVRVLQRLAIGDKTVEVGCIILMKQKFVDILEKQGAVAVVNAPPLAVLPGWERYASKLEPHGILEVGELFEALDNDTSIVGQWLGEQVSEVVTLKEKLLKWLIIPGNSKSG